MFGNRQDAHAGLRQPRAACVAQGMEGDVIEPSQRARLVKAMSEVMRLMAVLAGKNQIVIVALNPAHAPELLNQIGGDRGHVRIAVFSASNGYMG